MELLCLHDCLLWSLLSFNALLRVWWLRALPMPSPSQPPTRPIPVWWHHGRKNVIMVLSLVRSDLNLVSQSLTAPHSRRDLIMSALSPCSLFSFPPFISLRLSFSQPSSILLSLSVSAQVYWKHFSSCLWQARQMKNKFQIWSERPFNLWLCFLLVNTIAPLCSYVCVCDAVVVCAFLESLS